MERHPLSLTAKLVEVPSIETHEAWACTIVIACDLLGPGQAEVPIGNLTDEVGTRGEFPNREAALKRAMEQLATMIAAAGLVIRP